MIKTVKLSFYPEELLSIHDKIGYVRGLLLGLKSSIDELEDDKLLMDQAIDSLAGVYSMLSDEKRITFDVD